MRWSLKSRLQARSATCLQILGQFCRFRFRLELLGALRSGGHGRTDRRGKYIQFWYPEIPTWVSAAAFFVIINAINLTNVKVFGEMEFWFAIIKVIAVVAMIIFGGWLLFSGNGGPQATVRNLWEQGGFLPHGMTGLVMMMAIIMFSFGAGAGGDHRR